MLGHVQVISILMKREHPVIYYKGNTGENAQARRFSLRLDFRFELNEVCMSAGGRGGWGGAG